MEYLFNEELRRVGVVEEGLPAAVDTTIGSAPQSLPVVNTENPEHYSELLAAKQTALQELRRIVEHEAISSPVHLTIALTPESGNWKDCKLSDHQGHLTGRIGSDRQLLIEPLVWKGIQYQRSHVDSDVYRGSATNPTGHVGLIVAVESGREVARKWREEQTTAFRERLQRGKREADESDTRDHTVEHSPPREALGEDTSVIRERRNGLSASSGTL